MCVMPLVKFFLCVTTIVWSYVLICKPVEMLECLANNYNRVVVIVLILIINFTYVAIFPSSCIVFCCSLLIDKYKAKCNDILYLLLNSRIVRHIYICIVYYVVLCQVQ